MATNAVDETEPHETLVDQYFDLIRHVHVNEMDGRHCGAGNYDFKPLLATLQRRNYQGWVSLEAFDFTPGAERAFAGQDYTATHPAVLARVVAAMGIEHLGQMQVAETEGVHAFGQASDMIKFGPETQLTSIVDNWGPYYTKRIKAVIDSANMPTRQSRTMSIANR